MEWLSDYQRANAGRLINKNVKCRGSSKLVQHLLELKNCAIHYRNLKFLVEAGVEVRAVHKALAVEHKAWLQPCIDLNTDKRKAAKHEFEKDLFYS